MFKKKKKKEWFSPCCNGRHTRSSPGRRRRISFLSGRFCRSESQWKPPPAIYRTIQRSRWACRQCTWPWGTHKSFYWCTVERQNRVINIKQSPNHNNVRSVIPQFTPIRELYLNWSPFWNHLSYVWLLNTAFQRKKKTFCSLHFQTWRFSIIIYGYVKPWGDFLASGSFKELI